MNKVNGKFKLYFPIGIIMVIGILLYLLPIIFEYYVGKSIEEFILYNPLILLTCIFSTIIITFYIKHIKFPVLFRFSNKNEYWEIVAKSLNYSRSDSPTLFLCKEKDDYDSNERILSIGVDENEIKADREYLNISNKHDVRFINPFSINSFEPEISELVIRYYVHKSIESYCKNISFIKKVFYMDFNILRYSLILEIPGYDTLPKEIKNKFLTQLKTIRRINSDTIQINSDTIQINSN